MATTTPNFGWPVPTSTDLVKDGATAMEALGDAIDTSMVDLKGGTTGQVLAKASAADMDFSWTSPTTGDITGVTAGTGISGGGTSGDVTVTNSMATAIDAKGDLIAGTGADTFARLAVGTNGQVLKANSATATGLEWATDSTGMTNPMTTTGDTIYSSSGSTPARLGIGSTGQVLTVSGGVPTWATPATSTPGLAFVSATSFTSATSVSINNCFTSTYDNYVITITESSGTGGYYTAKLRLSGTDSSASYTYNTIQSISTTVSSSTSSSVTTGFAADANHQGQPAQTSIELFAPAIAQYTWYRSSGVFSSNPGGIGTRVANGNHSVATAYDGITISWTNSGTGTVRVYGYRNS